MARYGLAIDLSRCTGCYACIIACKSENSTLPGVFWIRIDEKEQGEHPKVARSYTPLLCMQCGEVPCAQACPSEAISKGEGGIIFIDEERCICDAVKPCIAACPFEVLMANKGRLSYFPDYLTPHEKQAYEAHRHAVVEKCTLCHHRITAGLLPACVQTCPSQAMIFGDLDEPQGDLAQLVSRGEAKPLREDLKADPSVFYLQRLAAP
ncbi:MAG: 4Fe-4S dicluster domain-containing protein [Deltaproteobacteria bacterium]|nr:4Fe-4S dicluster domain-containing protein [Deltaproteobacteria bacterium]